MNKPNPSAVCGLSAYHWRWRVWLVWAGDWGGHGGRQRRHGAHELVTDAGQQAAAGAPRRSGCAAVDYSARTRSHKQRGRLQLGVPAQMLFMLVNPTCVHYTIEYELIYLSGETLAKQFASGNSTCCGRTLVLLTSSHKCTDDVDAHANMRLVLVYDGI